MLARRFRRGAMLALVASAAACASAPPRLPPQATPLTAAVPSTRYVREELYFGLARSTGAVTDAEWSTFLAECVTPRFPDGLTVVRARGQYRMADGAIVGEDTHVLILLYKRDAPRAGEREVAIRAIIDEYKRRFAQESVLRVQGFVDVSF